MIRMTWLATAFLTSASSMTFSAAMMAELARATASSIRCRPAGLGKSGLGSSVPPWVVDPPHPTAEELRRLAIYNNYRALVDPTRIIKQRGLTQARAGEILGIKQPHLSALMRNRAGNFSVGRLIEFLWQ
jgi:predicted XRE-type DNA-binding protein